MAVNTTTIMGLLKARLDHPGQTMPKHIEEYWQAAIDAACRELEAKGISLQDTADDNMLVCDYAAYLLRNRDDNAGFPEWLRHRVRQRWAREYLGGDADES